MPECDLNARTSGPIWAQGHESIDGMKKAILLTGLLVIIVTIGHAQTPEGRKKEQAIKQEMQRLAAYEVDLVLRSDIAAMERFYPDDMIVTNPFNQVIDKPKVIERVESNIIKYSSMTKDVEHVRSFGDMVVTMGLETAKVTPDAARNDAGKTTYRRFTEVWTLRAGSWKKIVRHANHFEPNL
jgi:ketosteroid isomerase-like protein